jgi:two-component system probable response regulator PhcQ
MILVLTPLRRNIKGGVVMRHTILIVDDEPTIKAVLRDAFSREPYLILSAGCAEEALPMLDREEVDVVISDEKMPGMSGTEFLAINEGEIYRFFTKPCNVLDIALTVRQALQKRDLRKENQRLLNLEQQQSAMIKKLEIEYPGITKVSRDSKGEVLIDDSVDQRKWDTLIEEIGEAVRDHHALVARRA